MTTANPFTSAKAPPANQIMNMIAPDIALQQLQLTRQQALADLLRQQSMEADGPTETIGGWAIKKSPFEGISKIAKAFASNYMQEKNDAKQAELGKTTTDAQMRAFGLGGLPATPQQASELSLGTGAANGDIGPTNTNAARYAAALQGDTQSQPMIPSLPGRSKMESYIASQYMGMPEYQKMLAAQLAPTADASRARELGVGTPEQLLNYRAKHFKEGTMSMLPGQTNIMPDGQRFVAPNFETGIAGGFDAQGKPIAREVEGAIDIAAKREGEVKRAGARVTDNFAVPVKLDTKGGPVAMTPAQQREAANGGIDPAAITNPGNMRPPGASTGFAKYATPEEGLAAVDKNLQSYGKQGVNTVSAIISKWAPPNENNTAAYIAGVSKRLGVSADQKLDMNSPIVRQALSTAITLHEHGPAKVFSQQRQVGIPLQSDAEKARAEAGVKLETQPTIDRNIATAKDMAEYEKNLNGHVSESQALLQRIDQSRTALTKFSAGGGGQARSTLASFAQAIPGMPTSVVDRIAGGDLSASQEFQKYAAQEALQTMQQALASDSGKGSQGNRISMQLFIKNNPNIDTDPRAIEKIFNFQTQLHNNVLNQSNAYQEYKKSNKDVSTFPNYWANEEIKRGSVKPEIRTGYAKGNTAPQNIQSLLDKYK